MTEEKFGERIAVVEQKVDNNSNRIVNHAIRIEKLEANNDALVRLSTLMEVQTEMNKQQNEQMEKFGGVLDKMNSNLSNLNSTSDQLKNSIGDLSNRMSSIEETQDSHKIDIGKLWVKIFVGVAMISVALLSGWLMKSAGLK